MRYLKTQKYFHLVSRDHAKSLRFFDFRAQLSNVLLDLRFSLVKNLETPLKKCFFELIWILVLVGPFFPKSKSSRKITFSFEFSHFLPLNSRDSVKRHYVWRKIRIFLHDPGSSILYRPVTQFRSGTMTHRIGKL